MRTETRLGAADDFVNLVDEHDAVLLHRGDGVPGDLRRVSTPREGMQGCCHGYNSVRMRTCACRSHL